MFRLHKGGRPSSRNPGTLRGESLWFEAGIALLFYSTHPRSSAAIGEGNFFNPLTLLGRRASTQKPSSHDWGEYTGRGGCWPGDPARKWCGGKGDVTAALISP